MHYIAALTKMCFLSEYYIVFYFSLFPDFSNFGRPIVSFISLHFMVKYFFGNLLVIISVEFFREPRPYSCYENAPFTPFVKLSR